MNSLRKSGEMSVEKMIKTLMKLKKRQDILDAQLEDVRSDI